MRRVALSIVRFAESKFGAGKSRLVVAAFMFLRCLLPSGSAPRGVAFALQAARCMLRPCGRRIRWQLPCVCSHTCASARKPMRT